ncbi:MAG TPA: cysteine desulfurase family protein [Clostridia bacterium]|jgi:cysteine desulfurase|nr:cysteine desulfurase family protein [Clostridia bacterium]
MIYFDNAATTKCSSEALDIYNEYARDYFYNPSTLYAQGVKVKREINQARTDILNIINASSSDNLIFTSSGTESNVTALLGTKKKPGTRIIISASEHNSVYQTSMELKRRGFEVVFVPVDSRGLVNVDAFSTLLSKNVSLVSIMHVNNETGGINNIKKLAEMAKKASRDILFHSDGVQALGKIKIDITDLGVDFYSCSAHKIEGPKGCGALFIKNNQYIAPLIWGGGQEFNIRSSTENVPAIMSFSYALRNSYKSLDENLKKVNLLFNILYDYFSTYKDVKILSPHNGSPYILTVSLAGIRGEVMQHALETEDILIGTGSACVSNKKNKRIPEALNLETPFANGLIRISFNHNNTTEEASRFITSFEKIYKKLSNHN